MRDFRDEIKAFNNTSKIKMKFVEKDGIIYLGCQYTIDGQRLRPQLGISFTEGNDWRKALRDAKDTISELAKKPKLQIAQLDRKKQRAKESILSSSNGIITRGDEWIKQFPRETGTHFNMAVRAFRVFPAWKNDKDLRDVTRAECEQFKTFVSRLTYSDGKDYNETSRFDIVRRTRMFFGWCLKMDYIDKSPAVNMTYKMVEKPVLYFTDDELDRLKKTEISEKSMDAKAAFFFVSLTGVRPVDLQQMKFHEVGELVKGKYKVRDVAEFSQHKTKRIGKAVMASSECKAIIMQQWKQYGQDITANVFCLPTPRMLGQCFDKWLKDSEIPKNGRSFYKAKHSLGTRLGREGYSDREIGLVMGHAPGSRMTQRYIHPDLTSIIERQKKK